jgi:hypothetical protein
MQPKNKINVLNSERKYIGDLYDHADQLLDNLDDIKDVFDQYLAVKLYNWRYKWFCEHYDTEQWITDSLFDSITYNVCMNWQEVLDKYFEDDRPIYLQSNKHYSDMCRAKLDNGGIVPFYFRCNIPFPSEFEDMMNTSEDGERILKNNLTTTQLEDFEKEMIDYAWCID